MSSLTSKFVIKRDGREEVFSPEKIKSCLKSLAFGLDDDFVVRDIPSVVEVVEEGSVTGMTTIQVEELLSETCAYKTATHPDWGNLAGRICAISIRKCTKARFSESVIQSHELGCVTDDFLNTVLRYRDVLDASIQQDHDLLFDYFAWKTLLKSYLLRSEAKVLERPQYMFMRVAVAVYLMPRTHCNETASESERLKLCIDAYSMTSQLLYTHASPVLSNAGTPIQALASCYLTSNWNTSHQREDSGLECSNVADVSHMIRCMDEVAHCSELGGGIGLAVSSVRSEASCSYSTSLAVSSNSPVYGGLVPFLRVVNETVAFVNNGSRRKTSVAAYLEVWHLDITEFLKLRLSTGDERRRTREILTALWIPDLFMQRVRDGKKWTLFCPSVPKVELLQDAFGSAFEEMYESLEDSPDIPSSCRSVVDARRLWKAILSSLIETGTPYMLFKDACNRKCNQQHVDESKGFNAIRCGNLCAEVIQKSSAELTAVCNLASIALPQFLVSKEYKSVDSDMFLMDTCTVDDLAKLFDFQKLWDVCSVVVRGLDRAIDVMRYPTSNCKKASMHQRAVGIGVQGFADMLQLLELPFSSGPARLLNKCVFETIYHSALTTSVQLCKEAGGSYPDYEGSPIYRGILQPDMWGMAREDVSGLWGWQQLRASIRNFGVRNSLLTCCMPTATTGQLLSGSYGCDPYISNLFVRQTLDGEFVVINKNLVKCLQAVGLWNSDMKNRLMDSCGSVKVFRDIPTSIREVFLTAHEMKQRVLVDLAIERGPYVDQSQSLNLYMNGSDVEQRLSSALFYSWQHGLKTGVYYLKTQSSTYPTQVTLDLITRSEVEDPVLKKQKFLDDRIDECVVRQ